MGMCGSQDISVQLSQVRGCFTREGEQSCTVHISSHTLQHRGLWFSFSLCQKPAKVRGNLQQEGRPVGGGARRLAAGARRRRQARQAQEEAV